MISSQLIFYWSISSLNRGLEVLKEALENKGVTNEVKSKLRAEIYAILEDNSFEKPRLSQENLLINDLIREYMDFNNYKYSKSVFLKGILLFLRSRCYKSF